MSVGNRERGAANFTTYLSMIVFLLVCYMGFKFIPVYINAYDFDGALKTQAQYSGSMKPDETIYKELLQKAAELKLPITKANLKITRNQSQMTITADYTVPVKTLLFTYNWKFKEEETAVLF